jgi:RNA polymerase sigma-70 factor (ECF subfamily)
MDAPPPLDADRLLEHAAWVRRLARRLVSDPNVADDAAQDALTAALRSGPREEARTRAWFAAVVRSFVRRRARGEERRAQREEAVAQPERLDPTDEIVERAMASRAVVDAVLELPEPYRKTILMRWFDDVPPARIAEIRGEPVETVRTRLKRGHAMLRERLASLGVDSRSGRRVEGLRALTLLFDPLAAPVTLASSASAAAPVVGVGWMALNSKVLFAVAAAVVVATSWVAYEIVSRPSRSELDTAATSVAPAPSIGSGSVVPVEPIRASVPKQEVRSESDSPIATRPPPDLPDLTTETMEALTTLDHDPAIDATLSGLLNGDATADAFVAFGLGVIKKAKLIQDSSKYKEPKTPGKRRWIEYRAEDGSLCRAAIQRFVDSTGDSRKVGFESPFPTPRLVNAPDVLARGAVRLAIRQDKAQKILWSELDVALLPDSARTDGLKPFWSLMEYQSRGGCGKSLQLLEFGGRLHSLMVDYPRLIGVHEFAHEFEAPDPNWDEGRTLDGDLHSKLRELAEAIDGMIDR